MLIAVWQPRVLAFLTGVPVPVVILRSRDELKADLRRAGVAVRSAENARPGAGNREPRQQEQVPRQPMHQSKVHVLSTIQGQSRAKVVNAGRCRPHGVSIHGAAGRQWGTGQGQWSPSWL